MLGTGQKRRRKLACPHRVFSPEFKLRVLEESQAAVARRYEPCPHLILKWKQGMRSGSLGREGSGLSVQDLLHDQMIKGEIIQRQSPEIHLLKEALAKSASRSFVTNDKPSRSRRPAP
jgi:transposase-like protein